MNNSNEVTCLENLPDEIFLYVIFPLFSWEELYHTFFGLNQRLNNILRCLKHLDFTVNIESQHHPALNFFTPCITRLTVRLGQFDVTPFSGLHALTLEYPSLQQRDSIRPENFPDLKYLSLSYPLEDLILLDLIFSNAFKHLQICQFDRTLTNHSWNGSPKVRSVSTSVYDSYGIICVLRACPNIYRLRIVVYGTPQDKLSLPRHSISCMNLLLQRLFIRSKFEILPAVLTVTPNLKWLTFEEITLYYGSGHLDFTLEYLAEILSKLHQLSYLHFTGKTSALDGHSSLQNLHPLFKHVEYTASDVLIISGSISETG